MPYADAPGARIYYETHGDGEPLLLIPGYASTVEVYYANTAALARDLCVIALDPRGSGRSDVPPIDPPSPLVGEGPGVRYTMQAFADDCAAVLDAAGMESAHVLGVSFGGMIAQHLALRHPGRVRRLVLGCTTPGGAQHVLPPAEALELFLGSMEIEDQVVSMRARYPLHYSDAYTAKHDAALAAQARSTAHLRSSPEGRAGHLAAVQTHDTWDALPSIAAPTLVAHGAQDGVVPAENGRNLARRIPNARLKLYPQAKHIFFVECADEFNADVIEFLGESER